MPCKKLVRMPGKNNELFVQVWKTESQQLETSLAVDETEVDFEKRANRIQIAIDKFLKRQDRELDDRSVLRELAFIKEAGLPRDIAKNLDVPMREKITRSIIPELAEYNCLCFQSKPTTMRRMLIFPKAQSYHGYMRAMTKLIQRYNDQKVDKLDSRVRLVFKGKTVIRVDDVVFSNFKQLISEEIQRFLLR